MDTGSLVVSILWPPLIVHGVWACESHRSRTDMLWSCVWEDTFFCNRKHLKGFMHSIDAERVEDMSFAQFLKTS